MNEVMDTWNLFLDVILERRGGGTLRELFRCEGKIYFSHALDIGCLNDTTVATISLGFVR